MAVAVLVWLGALVYLLVLSRRKLPELGTGAGAGGGGGGAGGGETAYNQVKSSTFDTPFPGARVCLCGCVCAEFTAVRPPTAAPHNPVLKCGNKRLPVTLVDSLWLF